MAEINLVEAVNLALHRAMRDDPKVLLLGEDVGRNGGVFRATEGLWKAFGDGRVRDTPLSEALIAGLSVGLAASGYRPVAEIQFMGFMYSCIDQLANHASRMRNRTRGRLCCPMVMRTPFGGGVHAPEHHSESAEAMFAHIPGLRVVVPSTPSRAYGLLLAAVRSPDPVVFLEPTRLYRAFRERVRDDGVSMPLDRCIVERDGRDVTLVGWGAMMQEVRAAADELAASDILCEVIDVATLSPFDAATVLQSVEKTKRCVVVQEAPLSCGFGAEVVARIAQHDLMSLLAPVIRVAGADTVMPLPRLEARYMPQQQQIVDAVSQAMRYT
ncbi:MAG: alpha-ketoacid dehydrogenase subunit beta [Alphaproteobacteria bacterium]|nr:alpha-ketoacid dehydrogenase subunit beta [Alphaproteobacteria bacterium]